MKEISLYIHIPFCKKKCWYCDFPSFCGKDYLMVDYVKTLTKEIALRTENYIMKTIFIGGGTPTYLSLECLNYLKEAMLKVNKTMDCEFTVECNPGTLNEDILKLLKSMGVNRLSIGLQAVQNELLKSIGRIHDMNDFIDNYKLARKIGFNNINVDIMFGLPNQSIEQWRETINKVCELSPEHISSYSLIIEEDTPFYNLYKENKLNLPQENIERSMYLETLKLLKGFGYNQYEISNYSKAHKECRHNLVYWNLEDYIGCGSGAHSFMNNLRYRNEEKIEEYIMGMNSKNNSYAEIKENTLEDTIEEFMFMGLRKIEGIKESVFKNRFKKDIDFFYKEVIEKHRANGLLKRENNSIFLTERGIELSNYVMSDFIL
ncbi:radical SAM family heme chaperone HemW [Desnuesiella massiliensis]|uniref:radical SAM family heme chaperone HemW n=1 Tax=Desnuesiella massiliensis TaxID=1650662 RepID=UPI0006E43A7C|nr:radical SAM family heme chaperone HemW [Desnuesiella massiliensis]